MTPVPIKQYNHYWCYSNFWAPPPPLPLAAAPATVATPVLAAHAGTSRLLSPYQILENIVLQ